MTTQEILKTAQQRLAKAGVNDPLSEAELLLSHATKRSRESILAHPETKVNWRRRARFNNLIRRRKNHEPIAYVLGRKGFYGREFIVNQNVLIPRPETETLIEAALEEVRSLQPELVTILDIGTGSGAIGLTLAAELPESRVTLTDVSRKALRIAKRNAVRLQTASRTEFERLDVLNPEEQTPNLPPGFLVITANLPYLSEAHIKDAQPEIRKHEPRLALASGSDGLDHYRGLIKRLIEWKLSPDLMLLEADPHQFPQLEQLVATALPKHHISIRKDLSGTNRILTAKK